MKEKCCDACHQEKPLTQFIRNRNSPDGRQDTCRVCVDARYRVKVGLRRALGLVVHKYSPEARLKAKYGIDQKTYDLMADKQNGKCAICGIVDQLVVDHDHRLEEYGPVAIRGLLCSSCNLGLGCFKDNPKRLHAAIKYLRSFGAS